MPRKPTRRSDWRTGLGEDQPMAQHTLDLLARRGPQPEQNRDLVCETDHGRLDSETARAAVEDKGGDVAQFRGDMRCSGRTDAT